ncbi:uncharacterized protein LOC106131174 [Amyelois transitella]|uniref:uncharacterized protein LOC106131174 n=1 Tax=Amyelois transitella TaxID=680683 RepID=UPI00067C7E59|nr:uncharacterized protein LOC106131174 [Amyelois transitella]
MIWLIFLMGMCMPCWNAEPAACTEDSHCQEGYYCQTNVYFCRQCLRCEDYKRAPPPGTIECVKSVVECGGCLESKSSGNNDCGPKPSFMSPKFGRPESHEMRLPIYAWVLLVLLVVAMIIGGVLLIPFINKMTYTTVSRVECQLPPLGTNDQLESTWSAPPAYNAVVNMPSHIEEEQTFHLKPIETAPPNEAREFADRQATRPYSLPNYVRRPQLSTIPSPDSLSIHNNNTEMENSVDGVVTVRSPLMTTVDDVLQNGAASNLEVCPNGVRSSSQAIDTAASAAPENTHITPPVVVVNNNVHLQSVSLSGANIFMPHSPNSVERR